MHTPPQILLADRSDLLLVGLWAALRRCPSYTIIGAVTCPETLLEMIAVNQPDILIVDHQLDPAQDIFQLLGDMHDHSARSQCILTGHLYDGLYIRDLFHAGAMGYLYKGDDLGDCLHQAIETVSRQRQYLSPTANAEYLCAMQTPQRDWQLDSEAREVLRLLAQGQHVGQVALALQITPRRVYWVRRKLRERFGAATNEQLISRATAEGFVFPA